MCRLANGFAFNGPESSGVSDVNAASQELVTKRVNTFTDSLRAESTRLSASNMPPQREKTASTPELPTDASEDPDS